jgi:DNA polymerase V
MFALVDCNNFYASCERLFEPALNGRPIVVLSNNDGCVIARSEEAKALNIPMGAPAYLFDKVFTCNNVKVCSSNYTLYGDMSDRVMKTLASFVPRMELYSIDEAFLDLSNVPPAELATTAITIRNTVTRNTGIPVSIGIAPTKALAKMANRYAKKKRLQNGIFYAAAGEPMEAMLAFTEVENIWGIGHQYALLLKRNGFQTARDFIGINADWVRTNMSVVGLRLWNELRGTPSIGWEFEPKPKQRICTSRSFGRLTADYSIISEAVSNHAASCAEKLRKQQSVCRYVNVLISTNPHKLEHRQYKRSIVLECETPTSLPGEIIAYALRGLNLIFTRRDHLFMKCGVEVTGIIPKEMIQAGMFDQSCRNRRQAAATAMDKINGLYGAGTVKMAVQRFDRRFRLKAAHLSKRYTTRLSEVVNVII